MRAIWKGNISFALVTIPVSVFSATRSNDLSFKYLHRKDLSPVSYKRFCDAEAVEAPWEEITRGYEFEKGRFVEISEEELAGANAALSRTIEVVEFVDESEIDSIYFDKPYYLEPQKGGERAYALMREALARSGKVGVARVVLKSREHLAAVKPMGNMIALQTMRFAHEIVEPGAVSLPEAAKISDKEMNLANTLIEAMAGRFEPENYKDDYRDKLLDLIRKKVAGVAPAVAGAPARTPGAVIDLMEVLKQSLKKKGAGAAGGAKDARRRPAREKTVAVRGGSRKTETEKTRKAK